MIGLAGFDSLKRTQGKSNYTEEQQMITGVCKECEMAITWNADTSDWESADERSCQQVGSTISSYYQQHEPA